MSVTFEFSGSWEFDVEALDAQDTATILRNTYGTDILQFLKEWHIGDQITVTVDGEKVFGP